MSLLVLSNLINGANTPTLPAAPIPVPTDMLDTANSVTGATLGSFMSLPGNQLAVVIGTGLLIGSYVIPLGAKLVRRFLGRATRPAPIVPVEQPKAKPALSEKALKLLAELDRPIADDYSVESDYEGEIEPYKLPARPDSVPVGEDLTHANVTGVLDEFRHIAQESFPQWITSYIETKNPEILVRIWGKLKTDGERLAIHQAIAHQGDAAFSQHLAAFFANIVVTPNIRAELLSLASINNFLGSAQLIMRENATCRPTYQMSEEGRQVALALAPTREMKKIIDPKSCTIQ